MGYVMDVEPAVIDLSRLGPEETVECCEALRDLSRPFVLVADVDRPEVAVAASRTSAFEILPVGTSQPELDQSLEALSLCRTSAGFAPLQRTMIGASPSIRHVRTAVMHAAQSDCTVLILGESGTGKELTARAIHHASARRDEPFVAVNCAGLPETLLESELFGHVRGAFTDARQDREGLFLRAGAGTLFLDEVGEMPLSVQGHLLRALQERTLRPVGSDSEVPFAARVIAATHRDLEADVVQGRFRKDLFFRLDVLRLRLPPLRERGTDIISIAHAALARLCKRTGACCEPLAPDVARRLLSYPWPGNVRELENCLEHALVYAGSGRIGVQHLPPRLRQPEPEAPQGDDLSSLALPSVADNDGLITLEELERRYIERVLQVVRGNRTEAAKVLGVNRTTLYRKLLRYGHES
jgi:DNA-binding NtrC family response regulator